MMESKDHELPYEQLARVIVTKWLIGRPDCLYNLSSTNLGLHDAVRVIAEVVEKRIDLGDFESTAWEMALYSFRDYLEIGSSNDPADFALWMAETAMPIIKLPDGTVIHNPNAC